MKNLVKRLVSMGGRKSASTAKGLRSSVPGAAKRADMPLMTNPAKRETFKKNYYDRLTTTGRGNKDVRYGYQPTSPTRASKRYGTSGMTTAGKSRRTYSSLENARNAAAFR